MKIEQFDRDILRIRPGGFSSLLMLVSPILIGIALFVTGGTTTLNCVRDSAEIPVCELKRSLLGILVYTTQFRNLKDAYIAEEVDDEGTSTYRVELVTDDYHLISFTEYASTGRAKKEYVVEKVKMFVYANQPTLEIVQKNNEALIVGLALIIVSLLASIAGVRISKTTWTFDRINEVLIHRSSTLFGTKVTEYPLFDITDARVEVSQSSDNDSETHRVVLVTKHWKTIPLTLFYTSSNLKKKEMIAKQINKFLDMRWQTQTKHQ